MRIILILNFRSYGDFNEVKIFNVFSEELSKILSKLLFKKIKKYKVSEVILLVRLYIIYNQKRCHKSKFVFFFVICNCHVWFSLKISKEISLTYSDDLYSLFLSFLGSVFMLLNLLYVMFGSCKSISNNNQFP